MSNALVRQLHSSALSTYAPDQVQVVMQMAATLVKSRLTPRGIDTPEKAFYLIMKGRELNVPPIRAIERIHIIEGRTAMAAELMLELFKRRGGRSKWLDDPKDRTRAEIRLEAPNGDVHVEQFTLEDAKTAQLLGKDNWRKWPKAMMRARAIAAGLRAMGEAEGLYDPDELGALTTPDGEVISAEENADPKVLSIAAAAEAAPPSVQPPQEVSSPAPGAKTEPVEFPELVECWKWNKEAKEWMSIGLEKQRSLAQNAKIHVLKGEMGLSDDEWRSKLNGYYNKNSSAELSEDEASNLIERMEAHVKRFGTKASKSAKKEARAKEALADVGQMLAELPLEPGSDG